MQYVICIIFIGHDFHYKIELYLLNFLKNQLQHTQQIIQIILDYMKCEKILILLLFNSLEMYIEFTHICAIHCKTTY